MVICALNSFCSFSVVLDSIKVNQRWTGFLPMLVPVPSGLWNFLQLSEQLPLCAEFATEAKWVNFFFAVQNGCLAQLMLRRPGLS